MEPGKNRQEARDWTGNASDSDTRKSSGPI